jgi:hypothetical protein
MRPAFAIEMMPSSHCGHVEQLVFAVESISAER